MSDTSREAEVSPFTSDYKSTWQDRVMNILVTHDDKYTRESCMFKVRDVPSAPTMSRNCVPLHAIREAGTNVRTARPLIEECSVCFPKDNLRASLKFHVFFLVSTKLHGTFS